MAFFDAGLTARDVPHKVCLDLTPGYDIYTPAMFADGLVREARYMRSIWASVIGVWVPRAGMKSIKASPNYSRV